MSQTSGPPAATGSATGTATGSATGTATESIIAADTASATSSSRSGASRIDDVPLAPGFIVQEGRVEPLLARVARLERLTRALLYALVVVAVVGLGFVFDGLLVEHIIVRQKLMESKELKLIDNDGNARLFLRMYSKVPVLQIIDSDGKPRMSLGLRFDDSPFVELSDRSGRTRATFEITKDDAPALRMFDQDGNTTFNIN